MTASQLDRSPILTHDRGFVGASLNRLADQLRDGWSQARRVKVPSTYRRVTKVAICGMGGSHLGADILRSALVDQLRVPVTIVAEYVLPAWVDEQTLVMCSSYSGSTEETLAALKVAKARRAKIVVVTNGGQLAKEARRLGLPLYEYTATENPSGQPRLGVAYGMMAMLMCFRKLGFLKISEAEVARLSSIAWEVTKRFNTTRAVKNNAAKRIALAMAKKIPLLIGAEWTAGNLHSLNNQINENAKTFCSWYQLPDLNHHLLEGLRNRGVTKQIQALMIYDLEYAPRNHKRFALTIEILEQLGAKVTIYKPRGATRLEKAIDLLAFGGYLSWYLAAARNVKPADIPTVKYLKDQLAKR